MVTPPLQRAADIEHPVVLHGLWGPGSPPRPTLVQRTDEDFISALLDELQSPDPKTPVLAPPHRPGTAGGILRLFQPVHRVFNLVLLETHCESFMDPRLDPRKIDSAGFVIRRVLVAPDGSRSFQTWASSGGQPLGWRSLDSPTLDIDPDPAHRPPPHLTGQPDADAALAAPASLPAEEIVPLFVAPPTVAAATGRTILYGALPTASTARAGRPTKGAAPDHATWEQHLSLLLKPSSAPVSLWPAVSASQREATLDPADLNLPVRTDGEVEDQARLTGILVGPTRFLLLVRQLAQEFSLLRPHNASTRNALLAELNQLSIQRVDGASQPAGNYLLDAARFFFDPARSPATPVRRPQSWPAVPSARAARIADLLRQMSDEAELGSLAPPNAAGRFDAPAARYVLRAFVRVKRPCGCPPRTVWSPSSDEFTIVPWFESGPVPPPQVVLPDPFDPNFLKNARPGVAFSVPRKLAKVINQDPKKLLEGTPGTVDFGLDWLCGFNIPIITLCAFIVLNIFLNLLNIIFWWLPYVKICIPFPRPQQPPPQDPA